MTDLATHLPDDMPRNVAVAICIEALFGALQEFDREGLSPFVARWAAVDALVDRGVTVHEANGRWTGIARGIDDRGRLQVQTDATMRAVDAGEISIRLA